MTINDVMRQATKEHEIYFLLTAYVESLRFGDELSLLPTNLTMLPLCRLRRRGKALQTAPG